MFLNNNRPTLYIFYVLVVKLSKDSLFYHILFYSWGTRVNIDPQYLSSLHQRLKLGCPLNEATKFEATWHDKETLPAQRHQMPSIDQKCPALHQNGDFSMIKISKEIAVENLGNTPLFTMVFCNYKKTFSKFQE